MDAPYSDLTSVLVAALKAEPPQERDAAAAALALTYARDIDNGGDLSKLGPALLASLEALQMSPRARALAAKGMNSNGPARTSRLDELRKRRDRKNGAAAPDTAATGTDA